jgi:CYTH domain-containing protein
MTAWRRPVQAVIPLRQHAEPGRAVPVHTSHAKAAMLTVSGSIIGIRGQKENSMKEPNKDPNLKNAIIAAVIFAIIAISALVFGLIIPGVE